MSNLSKLRFKDATWMGYFDNKLILPSVIVGGVGGTGSWVSLFLSRIGFSLLVYDMDKVDETNLAGQFFNYKSVGDYKTNALERSILDYTGNYIRKYDKYSVNSYSFPFMFSCFDNMEARTTFFKNWEKRLKESPSTNKDEHILIDLRLLAEQMQIFCVTENTIDEYRKYLYSDEEVPEGVCSFKQTTHAAAIIAGQAISFFTNHLSNVVTGNKDRFVPFMWEYFIPTQSYNEIYL